MEISERLGFGIISRVHSCQWGTKLARGGSPGWAPGVAIGKRRALTSPFLCRDFQRVSHLRPSGVLDVPTLRQMGRPRCGTGDGESRPSAPRRRRSMQHGEHRGLGWGCWAGGWIARFLESRRAGSSRAYGILAWCLVSSSAHSTAGWSQGMGWDAAQFCAFHPQLVAPKSSFVGLAKGIQLLSSLLQGC